MPGKLLEEEFQEFEANANHKSDSEGEISDDDIEESRTKKKKTNNMAPEMATGNGSALSFLSQYVNKNKSGNEMDEEYAKAITNLLQNGMNKDEKESAIESRLVLSNCPRPDWSK